MTWNPFADLLKNGYKIFGFDENSPNYELEEAFKRENISSGAKAFFTSSTLPFTDCLGQGNVSIRAPVRILNTVQHWVNAKYPTARCHHAKNTVIKGDYHYFYFGNSQGKLGTVMNSMQSSGLISMNGEYIAYLLSLRYSKLERARIQRLNNLRKAAFQIRDWKMLSIFIGWGLLLGVAILVFCFENIYFVFSRRFRRTCETDTIVHMFIITKDR